MTRRSGFGLIPVTAKVAAAVAFVAFVVLCSRFTFFDEHAAIGFGPFAGAMMGALAGGFILLAGYVYADAGRRGMPPLPWTALAILVPNGIGFVLYFLLRKPLEHPCPGCRFGVPAGAAFCPACGQAQFNREVGEV